MWLLNTHTAELKFFARPGDVPGGYAILSHVWGNPEVDEDGSAIDKVPDEEDTFQGVRGAYEECQRYTTGVQTESAASRRHRGAPRNHHNASLVTKVHDLEGQVEYLTARLLELSSHLQKQNPTLTSSLPLNEISTGVSGGHTQNAAIYTAPSKNARDHLSTKIHDFLLQAEEHGFDWAWADTCCIDKTSSAELTEAINSMFDYYSLSEICYAYLSDVPPGHDANSWEFENSLWHTRGWTLQELISPKNVVFMANDWTRIGTKYDLADVLGQLQNMPPASVLRFEKDIGDASVSQRMSWASRRNTTRVEDEAYCLFGLFGVNMPTLYGEGRNAFYRLQEAIMSMSPDTSLFAWTGIGHSGTVATTSYLGLEDIKQRILGPSRLFEETFDGSDPLYHLLAPSPRHFGSMGDVVPSSRARESSKVGFSIMVCGYKKLFTVSSTRRCTHSKGKRRLCLLQ